MVASFVGMRVDGLLNLARSTFYIPPAFTYSEIKSEAIFDDVHFDSKGVADFQSMRTNAPLFFRRNRFVGKLILADADLYDLFFEETAPKSEPLDLDLTQAHVAHGVSFRSVSFWSLRAPFLVVAGESLFDNVVPRGSVNFAHGHFQNLKIINFDAWLGVAPNAINLEGFSFDSIEIPDAKNDPQAAKMPELLNSESCPYSPQPYIQLEKYLSAHGNPEKADDVYIDMRKRQRERVVWWKRPWDWLVYVLVGYGRKPWRAALFALLLACVGGFIFTKDRMESKDPQQAEWYNSLWYSLDLLAPVIDLGAAKQWRPRQEPHWVHNYALLHRLAGWILLPLVLAAITGLIK